MTSDKFICYSLNTLHVQAIRICVKMYISMQTTNQQMQILMGEDWRVMRKKHLPAHGRFQWFLVNNPLQQGLQQSALPG